MAREMRLDLWLPVSEPNKSSSHGNRVFFQGCSGVSHQLVALGQGSQTRGLHVARDAFWEFSNN